MKYVRTFRFAIAALVLFLFVTAAHGDSVGLTLVQTSQTATAGSTLTFDATITNLSTTDTIFLNGDGSTTSSPLLTVDDTPFLTNFPLSLAPSEVSGPFALFNITIDPTTSIGTYDFNSFSILGGLDDSSSDTIGTVDFSVVIGDVTVTPELGTLTLLLPGLVMTTFVAISRQFKKESRQWTKFAKERHNPRIVHSDGHRRNCTSY